MQFWRYFCAIISTGMTHTMKSLYCLLIVPSRTVAFIFAFLLYFISLIIVALLEFTQQLYSVQENLGPLIVNLRLASSSPSLATNLPANLIQANITSSGGTAIGTRKSTVMILIIQATNRFHYLHLKLTVQLIQSCL